MRNIFNIIVVILFFSSMAFAQNYDHIPLGISYQGILKASEGDTVVSDGLHPMRFYIYDGETGGSLLWQQPPSGQGSQQVETKSGLFNVILGSYSDTTNDFFSNVINDDPREVEKELLREFKLKHEKLPFANLKM